MSLPHVKTTIKNANVDQLTFVLIPKGGAFVSVYDWRLEGRSTRTGDFRNLMHNPSERTKPEATNDLKEIRKAARSLDIPLEVT